MYCEKEDKFHCLLDSTRSFDLRSSMSWSRSTESHSFSHCSLVIISSKCHANILMHAVINACNLKFHTCHSDWVMRLPLADHYYNTLNKTFENSQTSNYFRKIMIISPCLTIVLSSSNYLTKGRKKIFDKIQSIQREPTQSFFQPTWTTPNEKNFKPMILSFMNTQAMNWA